MERLRTLNSSQIFKIKIKKSKTYSGWCPFKGLSNDTTLRLIQSGRTVPLKVHQQKTSIFLLGKAGSTYRNLFHGAILSMFTPNRVMGWRGGGGLINLGTETYLYYVPTHSYMYTSIGVFTSWVGGPPRVFCRLSSWGKKIIEQGVQEGVAFVIQI
jgi:hypothetical protein